jgi:ATP-dependent Clp endopeptidase proteolytic subunit ClpP
MELHHVRNQTHESADIFLFNQIGQGGINATDFVNELRFLDTLGLKEINVRINSGGGSVMDGYGIFSAIRSVNTPVNTIIEGIAASIAGIIAMAGKNRSISDFGRLMVHDPSFGNARPNNKQQKALDTIKESLITVLANNSSLDESEISELMTSETWFNAEDALAFGFVDNVFSTAREQVTNELTIADVQNIANDLLDTNNNQLEINNDNMLNIKNHLGLNEEAVEGDVLEAVKALENKSNEAEAKVEELTNAHTTEVEDLNNQIKDVEEKHATEVEALNNNVTELNNELATMVVENAIKDGKFNADKKDELVEQASKDLSAFKNIIESVTANAAPVSITNLIENTEEVTNELDWDHYTKNEPNALNAMRINDVEAYNKLYADKFGVEPTK